MLAFMTETAQAYKVNGVYVGGNAWQHSSGRDRPVISELATHTDTESWWGGRR